jgi:hypothetical protein
VETDYIVSVTATNECGDESQPSENISVRIDIPGDDYSENGLWWKSISVMSGIGVGGMVIVLFCGGGMCLLVVILVKRKKRIQTDDQEMRFLR